MFDPIVVIAAAFEGGPLVFVPVTTPVTVSAANCVVRFSS